MVVWFVSGRFRFLLRQKSCGGGQGRFVVVKDRDGSVVLIFGERKRLRIAIRANGKNLVVP